MGNQILSHKSEIMSTRNNKAAYVKNVSGGARNFRTLVGQINWPSDASANRSSSSGGAIMSSPHFHVTKSLKGDKWYVSSEKAERLGGRGVSLSGFGFFCLPVPLGLFIAFRSSLALSEEPIACGGYYYYVAIRPPPPHTHTTAHRENTSPIGRTKSGTYRVKMRASAKFCRAFPFRVNHFALWNNAHADNRFFTVIARFHLHGFPSGGKRILHYYSNKDIVSWSRCDLLGSNSSM